MKLTELENQFDIKYPELFKQLEADGMLDWSDAIVKMRAGKSVTTPPFLWFDFHNITLDFEIWRHDDIVEHIAERWPAPKPELKLIPFGMNGAGDNYSFCFGLQDGDDVPIVFVPHDDVNATIIAKNIQDFMFISMLKFATMLDLEDIETEEQQLEFRNSMKSTFATHKKYLTSEQADIITDVYARELQEYTDTSLRIPYTYKSLISEEELEEVLNKYCPYDRRGEEFEYEL